MKAEATTYSPVSKMTRGGALKRIGAGALAILGATKFGELAGRRIPYWAGAEKRHELLISFQRHDSGKFAQPIIAAVDAASKARRPFHVFFKETALMQRTEFAETIRTLESNAENYRKYYASLRKEGANDAAARQELVKAYLKINPDATEFNAVLETELALRNVHVVPIEAYSAEESAIIYANYKSFKANMDEIDRLKEQNAPLLELQKAERREAANMLGVTKMRDTRIREQLPFLFSEVKRLFPELSMEPQLRAIGSLGTGHRNAFAFLDRKKSGIHVEEMMQANEYSLLEHVGRNALSFRVMNEKDARRMALAPYVDGNFRALKEAGEEHLAKKAFSRALTLSQTEFVQLSEATERMGRNLRMAFIMNFLLGEKYY
ncbi:Uncharacterised protein [uncultured archaeon]|nr:Uncharacterised protein [uncultured archaeon]